MPYRTNSSGISLLLAAIGLMASPFRIQAHEAVPGAHDCASNSKTGSTDENARLGENSESVSLSRNASAEAAAAQSGARSDAAPASVQEPGASAIDDKPAQPQKSKPTGTSRWLEISSLHINARYRFIQTTQGVTTTSHLQYKDSLVVRLKFDEKGRYSLNAGVHTGTTFISGW